MFDFRDRNYRKSYADEFLKKLHCWNAHIFLAVAVVISFSKLPEVRELYCDSNGAGAQVSVASFVILTVEHVTLNQAWFVSVGMRCRS
jgi:hypothetical protein